LYSYIKAREPSLCPENQRITMGLLPAGLYSVTGTAALFAAATEQEQRRSAPAFPAADATLKQRMMPTAFAPVEKRKIALYSGVSSEQLAAPWPAPPAFGRS
jgi:hypothetical protein